MDGLAAVLKAQARANALAARALAAARTDPESKYFVYALLLQDGRIYVGQTDNIYQRLLDHFAMTKFAAQWVRLHGPPVRVLEILVDVDKDAENYLTLSYIAKFGADSVRGGSWHSVFTREPACVAQFTPHKLYKALSREQIEDVQAEVRANAKLLQS